MTDLASLIVPAAAALAGVVLSQLMTRHFESSNFRNHLHEQAVADRRTAVLGYLVAINQAIGYTRDHMKELMRSGNAKEFVVDLGPLDQFADHPERYPELKIDDSAAGDRDNDLWWAAAFDAFLAVELILPQPALDTARNHLDDAFAWRRRCFRRGKLESEPSHRALIESLGPWIGRETDWRPART
jgi:hypothetical protein